MKNQFSDYETSKMLKELGFNFQCLKYYTTITIREVSTKKSAEQEQQILHTANCFNSEMSENDDCSAPLWQQVKQWIYETHQAYIKLDFDKDGYYVASLVSEDGNWNFVLGNNKIHDYVEAENDAIKKSVEWLYQNIEK